MSQDRARNRLARESSPYLLQHAGNPVDWYPWGQEAIEHARSQSLPVLLSIGYAACHWCHVMERESFEDPATAALMNERFVCIKVDREERPDVDDIYMRAVQMMTGHGGWPLTVFLTPGMEPFYGGTYFPPEPRMGMPSFRDVLNGVADAWEQRPSEAQSVAADLREHLQQRAAPPGPAVLLEHEIVYRGAMELRDRFDPNYGGYTPAPKFPNSTLVTLQLRTAHRHHDAELGDEAVFTLGQMAAGGLQDHAGGGFHRYSTDAQWLVPHFEKMLYDNALLTVAYLEAQQLTGKSGLGRVAGRTLDWALREMQSPEGGYYSTLDADSEGVEGKFYVWSRAEVEEILGADAGRFCLALDVTDSGNWEGTNILHLPRPLENVGSELGISAGELGAEIDRGLEQLREAREARTRPALDDKVLSDWNGLMIAAMARGHRVLGDARYLDSARRAADFVLGSMVREGRLLHTHRDGESKLLAYLDGYANMLWASVELFETTFEARWLAAARQFADGLLDLFADEDGGFRFTGRDHEELIATTKSGHDGATPSGNAIAATWLQRLARLTGENRYDDAARDTLYAFAPLVRRGPSSFAQMLLAVDDHLAEPREVVVVGDPADPATLAGLQALWHRYEPGEIVLLLDPGRDDLAEITAQVPLFEGRSDPAGERPAFFVCRNHTCEAPTSELEQALES